MIEVKNAVMRFDDKNALDGVSLTIPEGCAYGLLGSNGAGKSTLLRALSGIYRLSSGELFIDGEPVYDNAKVKERVFFINDETVQFNSMTLTEMKQYYKSFYGTFSEELWQKLYSALNLPLKKRLNTFSKGMKRQAAVICGIACRTPYLFLDEAFDGLDPTMRIIVKQMLIDAMVDSKLAVIFSSHNLGERDEFKIQTSFPEPVTKEQLSADGVDILHIEENGSVMHIIARGDREKVRAAVEKHSPRLYDEVPLSLEEIFIYEMEVLGYDSSKLGK